MGKMSMPGLGLRVDTLRWILFCALLAAKSKPGLRVKSGCGSHAPASGGSCRWHARRAQPPHVSNTRRMITNAMTTQKRVTSWTAYLVLAGEPLPGGLTARPDRSPRFATTPPGSSAMG